MKLHTSGCVGNQLTDSWKWTYTQVILCGQPAYWRLTIAGNENYTQVICVGNLLTDAQNFVSPFLIYPDNSINLPNGGILSL